MADPLSIIGSIVGIAVASAQLANKVHDFADKYRNAPAQMHDVAAEMSQLSSIFDLLANVLKEGSGTYKPQVLSDANDMLNRVQKIQEEIMKLMKSNSGIRARMKWVLSAGKVGELLDRIEALKSSLSILLDTTQLAIAHRDSLSDRTENERLKELIVAGVKEIRHCVVGLQIARPALMYEPPKLLTAGDSADALSSRAYPWLPLVNVPPPVPDGAIGPRSRQPAIEHATDAIKPSDSQFETASWLHSITFARAEVDQKEPSAAQDRPKHSDESQKPSQQSKDEYMKVAFAPSPRRLYDLSVAAVVYKLIRTWTYIDPVKLFTGLDLREGEGPDITDITTDKEDFDDSEDEGGDETSSPEPLRRRFTFPDYDQALDTGDLHNVSSRPRGTGARAFDDRRSGITDPDLRYSSDRRHRLPPNVNIYNTTRMNPEGGPDLRKSSGKSTRADPAWSKRREYELELHDEIERLRFELYGDRHTRPRSRRDPNWDPDAQEEWYTHDHTPTSTHQKFAQTQRRLKEAEAKLDFERRRESKERSERTMEEYAHLLKLSEQKDRDRQAEEERRNDGKLGRLEHLLIQQQEAQIAKDKAKKIARTEAKKQMEDDRLARLEQLIIDQRREQLQRESEAATERESKDALARQLAEKEAASAEMAAELQQAVQQACEEVEERAAQKLSHERELRRHAEEMAYAPSPPSQSDPNDDTVVSEKAFLAVNVLVDMLYGGEPEGRWYQTSSGPKLVDTSNGYFARKILRDMNSTAPLLLHSLKLGQLQSRGVAGEQAFVCEPSDDGSYSPAAQTGQPVNQHLVFSTSSRGSSPECTAIATSLRKQGVEPLFEVDEGEGLSKIQRKGDALVQVSVDGSYSDLAEHILSRSVDDVFIDASLLWQTFPRDGQSELYRSLCKVGWKPTYLRTTEKGQIWFHGDQPIHVRFNRPDYMPRLANFEDDKIHDCVVIGSDIVDEDALRLTGIEHEPSRPGWWKLEPTVTYEDIAALVATSFSLREMSLRRVARKAVNKTATKFGSSNGTASPTPSIPALKAFSHTPEPSLGAEEDAKDGSRDSTD